MTSPRFVALAASLVLLSVTTPSVAEGRSVMDRLAALFVQGRPIGFQVVFQTLETTHDLDVNTTVAEVKEVDDAARGRHLAVFTASYSREGIDHRFAFLIRDGELVHVELQRRVSERWERAPAEDFSFQTNEDPPPPDFLGDGDAVLVASGYCTPSRGATTRRSAVIALRSFHTADGKPPSY